MTGTTYDTRLVRRAAFAQIAAQHRQNLLRVARRLYGGNEDRAQDVVQDALMNAFQACMNGRFREGSNVQAWLTRILINLSINDQRRRRKWEADGGLDTPVARNKMNAEAMRVSQTPSAILTTAVLDESLERALASLSEKLRRCVILVDMEELDYAETARALGIPIGTVRSRLSRARLEMRLLLGNFVNETNEDDRENANADN